MDLVPKIEDANKLEAIKSPTTIAHQPLQISNSIQSKVAQAPNSQTVTTVQPASSPQPKPLQVLATSQLGSIEPAALVIIPQHPATTSTTPPKAVTTLSTRPPQSITTTGINSVPAHVTLTTAPIQSAPLQIHAPVTPQLPNISQIPITAHQQPIAPITQPTVTNRPPSTLPVVPITTTSAIVKPEPNKYICCLLDNGVRCDRVAGNASFSARIQKMIATKKVNLTLDPTVRHAYICDQHKSILTVAKKSTPLVRDTKSNARNYAANNNSNTLPSQPDMNYNDFTLRQQALQHPVNLDLLGNQNRLTNNHTGTINNLPVRQGAQIAFSHYPANHHNQVGFDPTGGDNVPSSSGGVDVDLQQLQVNTLRRYKRHFRVQTRPGLNKLQLAESLKSHFRTLPIIEKEAITYFVYIVKCYRNKLDHNPKAD